MSTRLLKSNGARYQLLPFLLNEAKKKTEQGRYSPFNRKIFGSFHSALASRLNISVQNDDQKDTFLSAINHPKLDDRQIEKFFSFKKIGESVVRFLASEFIYFTFPTITTRDMKTLNSKYTSKESLDKIARTYGIAAYYEFLEEAREEKIESTFALIGLMHQWKGLKEVRGFLNENLFKIPFQNSLPDGTNPSVRLNMLMRRYNQPLIMHRIVAESGRGDESSSVFVVNAYSGVNLLGQGMGRTLQMAKRNANEVALQKLTHKPQHIVSYPSVSKEETWDKSFSSFVP